MTSYIEASQAGYNATVCTFKQYVSDEFMDYESGIYMCTLCNVQKGKEQEEVIKHVFDIENKYNNENFYYSSEHGSKVEACKGRSMFDFTSDIAIKVYFIKLIFES